MSARSWLANEGGKHLVLVGKQVSNSGNPAADLFVLFWNELLQMSSTYCFFFCSQEQKKKNAELKLLSNLKFYSSYE